MAYKILVIDDDVSILDALTMVLESEGYKVATTFKGEETYEKVDSYKPDVILLDVLMSGNDGRVICRNLKNDPRTKNIPIIMISAHPSAKDHAMEHGADDFLAKPFDSEDLLRMISKYT